MPGYDGTGPMGQGAMTGRGRGFCIQPYQGNMGRFSGCRGLRNGFRNRGYGRGANFSAEMDNYELEELTKQVNSLKEQVNGLTGILERIADKSDDKEGKEA